MFDRDVLHRRTSLLASCALAATAYCGAAIAYGGTAHAEGGNLAWFANEAYAAKPRNIAGVNVVYRGGGGELTIWRSTVAPGAESTCVIAWRGSTGPLLVSKDWRANEWSQFAFLAQIPGAPSNVKGGRGWVSRFNKYRAKLQSETASCSNFYITGHSLGGAMAVITRASLGKGTLEAYNAARPGNKALADLARSAGGKGFCRKGDPVPATPVGNVAFCTEPLAAQKKFGIRSLLAGNHDMSLWPLRTPTLLTSVQLPQFQFAKKKAVAQKAVAQRAKPGARKLGARKAGAPNGKAKGARKASARKPGARKAAPRNAAAGKGKVKSQGKGKAKARKPTRKAPPRKRK